MSHQVRGLRSGAPADPVFLDDLVHGWLHDGVVNTEQADAMLRSGPVEVWAAASRRRSMVGEALGYLGGATIVAAVMLLVARWWPTIATPGRAALLASTSAVLVAAGALVRTGRRGGQRLRAVLWLAAVPVAGALVAVVADALGADDPDTTALAAVGAAVCAALLWAVRPFVVLQVAAGASLMVASGAWVTGWTDVEGLPGLAAWSVGLVWVLLVVSDVLRPRRVPLTAAGAGVLVGALTTTGTGAGTLFAVGTVAVLMGTAVLVREVALLVVAGIGVLQLVPLLADRWLPDSAAAPLALIALGVVLVVFAVWADRRRGPRTDAPRPPFRLPTHVALASAGGVLTVVAAVLALLGHP